MRDSGGNLWAVWILSSGTIRVANSTDSGSTWNLKTSAGLPSNANYKGVSAAIDGSDRIQIAYWDNTLLTGGARYGIFYTSSSVYGGDQLIGGISITLTTTPGTAIAVDSNGKSHVAFVEFTNCCGGAHRDTVYYTHNVAGTWLSPSRLGGAPDDYDCSNPDIMVDNNNLAEVAYWCSAPYIETGIANANNATFMTLTEFPGPNQHGGGIVMDSSNNSWICGGSSVTDKVLLYKHASGAAWSTWTGPIDSLSVSKVSEKISCAASGADIYTFYILNSNGHVVYSKYSGTTWSGPADAATGTLQTPTVKWSQYNNNLGATLDYIYGDGSNIYWDKFNVPAGASFDALLLAGN